MDNVKISFETVILFVVGAYASYKLSKLFDKYNPQNESNRLKENILSTKKRKIYIGNENILNEFKNHKIFELAKKFNSDTMSWYERLSTPYMFIGFKNFKDSNLTSVNLKFKELIYRIEKGKSLNQLLYAINEQNDALDNKNGTKLLLINAVPYAEYLNVLSKIITKKINNENR